MRALERLAAAEKAQAAKLQSLMQASRGESVLGDSYFQTLEMGERTLLSDQMLGESGKSFAESAEDLEGRVEVVRLSEASVHRKQEGVWVVKERGPGEGREGRVI